MLRRQVNMTSLGDHPRETLTIAGLEKAKERALCCVQVWISTCERQWTRVLLNLRQWKSALLCQRVPVVGKLDTRKRDVDPAMRRASIAAKLDI